MTKKLSGAALLLVALAGCRMCSDCCDDSPPVADNPYASAYGRAGSLHGGAVIEIPPVEGASAAPTPAMPAPPTDEELAQPPAPPAIQPPALSPPEY
jgi:hypothetical protein